MNLIQTKVAHNIVTVLVDYKIESLVFNKVFDS